MKNLLLRALFLMVAVLSASLLHANIDLKSGKYANAVALSKAMLPEKDFKQMADAIVQTGLKATREKIETDKLSIDLDKKGSELEKSLRTEFTYEYFLSLNSRTMARNFSEDELGKILAFYNTEAGQKWTKNTPEIISETMMQIQFDLQEKLPQFLKDMVSK